MLLPQNLIKDIHGEHSCHLLQVNIGAVSKFQSILSVNSHHFLPYTALGMDLNENNSSGRLEENKTNKQNELKAGER